MMLQGWEFTNFNIWPQVYMVAMAVLGAFLAGMLAHRRIDFLARGVVVGLGAGTVFLHFLTWQILAVDPTRASGDIPLSEPWPIVVDGLILCLFFPGFLWQGFLAGALLSKKRAMRASWVLATVAVSVYSAWMLPWMAVVIFD